MNQNKYYLLVENSLPPAQIWHDCRISDTFRLCSTILPLFRVMHCSIIITSREISRKTKIWRSKMLAVLFDILTCITSEQFWLIGSCYCFGGSDESRILAFTSCSTAFVTHLMLDNLCDSSCSLAPTYKRCTSIFYETWYSICKKQGAAFQH